MPRLSRMRAALVFVVMGRAMLYAPARASTAFSLETTGGLARFGLLSLGRGAVPVGEPAVPRCARGRSARAAVVEEEHLEGAGLAEPGLVVGARQDAERVGDRALRELRGEGGVRVVERVALAGEQVEVAWAGRGDGPGEPVGVSGG